jgi:hypothetical protein
MSPLARSIPVTVFTDGPKSRTRQPLYCPLWRVMVEAWEAAARGRCKEFLARGQVNKVANNTLPSHNIYPMEGEGTWCSNSTRIPRTPSNGPCGKVDMIPKVGKTTVATARCRHVERGVTLGPTPNSQFLI